MKVAIIGPPQSGKTTLLGVATGHSPEAGAMAQVHHAIAKVPDPRLQFLSRLYKPKRVTEATIEFIDVPGCSLADRGGIEDLKRHLPMIRQSEMLAIVLRAFDDPAVPPYRGRIDPAADLREMFEELLLADLETITNRMDRLDKALKKPTKDRERHLQEHGLLTRCREVLEDSAPLSQVLTGAEDRSLVAGFGLLSLKPLLVVYNVSEGTAGDPDPQPPPGAAAAVHLCARAELEISRLDPADQSAFLTDLGVDRPGGERLIRKCYDVMGLISFLTVGPTEARAWTLERGCDALTAAGKIHSDMARGFIRAETVAFDDLQEAGDMKAARAAAKVRQEGKTYIVQDGDVILFRFNV